MFNASPIPRYVQLSDLFRQRVARGVWPIGTRIPTLEQIVAEFGVSRMTARQAIDVLSREGLLTPERGRGTFVSGAPPDTPWLKMETSLAKLAEVYRDTLPTILNIEPVSSAPPLTPADGTPAAAYMQMRRVHTKDERAYNVISIYLARDLFDLAPERFRNETVVSVLQDMAAVHAVKIARAWQTLTISTADLDVAAHLDIPINSPVADVRRVFCDDTGRVIYLSLITYRGDFIRLEMDLKP